MVLGIRVQPITHTHTHTPHAPMVTNHMLDGGHTLGWMKKGLRGGGGGGRGSGDKEAGLKALMMTHQLCRKELFFKKNSPMIHTPK